MRIGLITFHFGDNYGGVLQALATQVLLQKYDATAEIINFMPVGWGHRPWWRGWGIQDGVNISSISKKLVQLQYGDKCRIQFEAFRMLHFRRTVAVHDKEVCQFLFESYDVLVSGSDQIWHFERPDAYFLATNDRFTGRKISYASCCGNTDQPWERQAEIKKLLSSFEKISVRNDFSADIIERTTGCRPAVVADPTLIADLTVFEEECALPWDKYILVYCIGNEISGSFQVAIEEIRNRVGQLPVVAVVVASQYPMCYYGVQKTIYSASPGQWMRLFRNASFVYTDSFHGVLFSLKYRRSFIAYYREKSRSHRMLDLIARYGLHDNIFDSVCELSKGMNWQNPLAETIMNTLAKDVLFSSSYLSRALKFE